MSKTLIIGGVAGGATTAARLRRKDESMDIIIFEKGAYISYANCGLPYYIGDVIKSRDALLLQTPQMIKQKFNIDVRVASEVLEIRPEEKIVIVKELETGRVYQENYDTLVIATGSSPLKPPIPGIEGNNIYTLWTIPDMDMIKKAIIEKNPRSAAVIGGGFIGLEMAENLHHAGVKVSVIEMQNQVMAPIDYEMAQLLQENMTQNQVEVILEDGVDSFEEVQGRTMIRLKSGKEIIVDMVILSIGVKPNSKLGNQAGLQLNTRGGIVVDEYLRTSQQDIYAVGDVIEVEHYVTKSKTMIPLAGPANKQGRICADNITGGRKVYKGTMGTSIAQVFDLSVATVGINEKTLQAMGKEKAKDYFSIIINQKSHAGYYPGATPITLKLLFDTTGHIYGAQIIGQDGVDKRIDTIATTMCLGGTVEDLAELELAYAPPFSAAKDPVNMLGFVAQNILEGLVSFIDYKELDALMSDEKKKGTYVILDVTEDVERIVYQIPNSYHIPLGRLRERMEELAKDKLIIPYCAIGVRSYNAARILSQHGFQHVKVLEAGTAFYKSMHYQQMNSREEGITRDNGVDRNDTNGIQKAVRILDCCGLQCPGPIMKVNESLAEMQEGEVLQICATDMGFARDVEAWCRRTGNQLVGKERKGKEQIVYIQKGKSRCEVTQRISHTELPQGKTLIVFSGDLDKVLAAFIIANGAASMGRPVTMFFTFWGLNALRKSEKQRTKKPFLDRMFGTMMPRGTKRLKLSKMNMAGMGTQMMKKVMKDKNVDSLEALMKQAMKNGVKLIACTMSMDVMGITREELIEGVEFAGVASYLGDAEESNVNLFI
ncbi:DsrE/DsrF/DrsH-like family protein [Lachnospiraceae bacterium LCP25S3_G4]